MIFCKRFLKFARGTTEPENILRYKNIGVLNTENICGVSGVSCEILRSTRGCNPVIYF